MKIIVIDEVNCFLDDITESKLESIQSKLAVYKKDYFNDPMYQTGAWDGKISPVGEDGRFPLFLIDQVIQASGVEPEIVDERAELPSDPPEGSVTPDMLGHGIELRWYQTDAIEATREFQKGILELCTSAGKTLTCAGISKLYEPCKSMVIVPSEKLVKQTVKEYESVGLDVGGIHGKTTKKQRLVSLEKQHLITTWQTLNNNRQWCADYDVVLYDECHVMGDVGYSILADDFGHAFIRIGLTGTVPKDKQKALWLKMHMGGDVLLKVESKQLQDEGYIAKVDVDIFKFNLDISMVPPHLWDWPRERGTMMRHHPRIDAMAHEIMNLPQENTLILVHPELGKRLSEILGCGFIDQETKSKDRDALCEPFDTETDYKLVASYGTLGTGVSINNILHLVMIDVGKNFVHIVQGAGRGMRKDSEGRMMCKIYDFYSPMKYGEKHFKERRKIYKEKSFPFKIVKEIEIRD